MNSDIEIDIIVAIEYSLELATSWTIDTISEDIWKFGRGAKILDEATTLVDMIDGTKTINGTRARILAREGRQLCGYYRGTESSGFKFRSNIRIWFRLDKFADIIEQEDDIVRFASRTLDRVPGDLILRFVDGESVWLLRQRGELTLNESDFIWPPRRLEMIAQPYRRATAIIDE